MQNKHFITLKISYLPYLYIAVIALSFMRTAMSGTHCTSPQLDGFKLQVEYQWVSPPRVLRESHFCLSAG